MVSVKPSTTEEIVRELWDRQQISDVMLRFGQGPAGSGAPLTVMHQWR